MLRERYKNRLAGLPVDGSADVAAPGGVFDQQNVAAMKGPSGSGADLDFDTALKHQNELATWGIVPGIVIVAVCFTEDNALHRKQLGKSADFTCILEWDVQLRKAGFSIFVGVDTGHFHLQSQLVVGLLEYLCPGLR